MPKASGNKASAPSKAAAANGGVVPLPKHRKPRRVYKEAVNKNRFGCRGRLITGPDRKYFWLAFIMIIVPGIAFLAAVYVLLSLHLSILYSTASFLRFPWDAADKLPAEAGNLFRLLSPFSCFPLFQTPPNPLSNLRTIPSSNNTECQTL